MRLAAVAVLLAPVLAPTLAAADPTLEVGAGVGRTQDSSDATAGMGTIGALDIYGRMRVFGPFAAQVELGKIDATDQTSVRSASVLGVAELTSGRVVPLLLAGIGIDQVGTGLMSDATTSYTHVEYGVGLQIRISGGLTLGIDVRQGTRTLRDPQPPVAVEGGVGLAPGPTAVPVEQGISAGDYRTVRATLGIRF